MLSLRGHDGMDADGPVGTGVREHSSPDVGGGERWWGPLGGRVGGREFCVLTSWGSGWAVGDVGRSGV